jgi:hypothetical protein
VTVVIGETRIVVPTTSQSSGGAVSAVRNAILRSIRQASAWLDD